MAILEIKKTSLWKDVNSIINNNDTITFFRWTGQVHNSKYNLNIVKITNFDIIRDYEGNVGDHIHIEFLLALGDFIKYFFPYKENCYITITQTPRTFNDLPMPNSSGPIKATYKVVYLEKDNAPLNKIEATERFDTNALNLKDTVLIKCQLLDLSLQALRILYTGGSFTNMTYKDILYHTVGSDSLKVKVNGKPSIDAIDITEPDNNEIQTSTVIPDGTPIIKVPTYLQESRKGIYSTGLGMYLQKYNNNKTWFVYPLYNTALYATKSQKAILYVVPPEAYTWVEKTFAVVNKVVKIVCIGDKHYISDGHSKIMDKGNGFRMSSAQAFMKKPVVMKASGPEASRSRLNYEVANANVANGLNYGAVPKAEISDNPFHQYSTISKTYTDKINVVWHNSNPDLIYPGMPVKFMYLSNNQLVSITGIIIFTHTSVVMANKGLMNGIYYSNTAITLLVDKGNKLDVGNPTGANG
jgi:hypothetical protein